MVFWTMVKRHYSNVSFKPHFFVLGIYSWIDLIAGRVKLACDLVSQYLPPHLSQEFLSKFEWVQHSLYEGSHAEEYLFHSFNALNAHIQSLQKLSMVTAVPSSSKDKESTNKTEGDGKKRKAASQSSRGVEKLKKADVKGMAKLSKFFQKKDAPSKAWVLHCYFPPPVTCIYDSTGVSFVI